MPGGERDKAKRVAVHTMDSPQHREPASAEFKRLAPRVVHAIQAWIERGEETGTPVTPWETVDEYQGCMELTLPTEPYDEDRLVAEIQAILANSVNPWTRRFLAKLYTTPTVTSVLGDLVLGAMNASVHVFSASPMLSRIEEKCVAGLCELMRLGPEADGVSLPGGAASNTLAVQTMLSQACHGVYRQGGVWALMQKLEQEHGRRGPGARPAILTSAHSHFRYVGSYSHNQYQTSGLGGRSRDGCSRTYTL